MMGMKLRWLLMLVLLWAAPLALAQDEEASAVPADLAGTYVIVADGGSFAASDAVEGAYVLTLNDVPKVITWVINAPLFNGGIYDNLFFASDWAAGPEGLTTDAILTTDSFSVLLKLSAPSYDPATGEMSFLALVDEIIPFEESKDEPELAESFEGGTLFVSTSAEFAQGLADGLSARLAGTRLVFGTGACTPGVNCPGDSR